MKFNACLVASANQLDALAAQAYRKLYPSIFKGSTTAQKDGVSIPVTYDATTPPTFDLTAHGPAAVRARFTRLGADEPAAAAAFAPADRNLMDILADAAAVFDLVIASVNVTATYGGQTTAFTIALRVHAQAGATSAGLVLTADSVSVTTTEKDPFSQYLADSVIAPLVEKDASSILAGMALKFPSIANISFGAPVVSVLDGHVVAAVNRVENGTPVFDAKQLPGDWPASEALLLMDQDLIATAATRAVGPSQNFTGGDESCSGWWEFKACAHYNYNATVSPRNWKIDGAGVAATFGLNASAGAGFSVIGISAGGSVDISASPDPSAELAAQVNGSNIDLVIARVGDFSISCHLNGPFGSILGWMVDFIFNGIANGLKPSIIGYIQGTRVKSISLPTYSVTVAGKNLTVGFTNAQIGNVDGMLSVVTTVAIS